MRIQLLGKISAIGERIPLQIENSKKKIRKAKKVVRKLVKYLPVFVSMEVSVVKRISDRRLGATGIDINPELIPISWCLPN